jgi:peptidylprolyl isomerase
VLAAVLGLAEAKARPEHAEALRRRVDEVLGVALPDPAQALAAALAALSGREGVEDTERARLRAALRRLAEHPSAFARRAAREAMEGLGMETPKETGARNDWRGLPRPSGPVLGLDLGEGAPFLSEAEILRIADRIAAERPRVVFDTTAGRFAVELEPEHAPVHAVNALLCALAGVYDGTRWHRVVPSFVIQGGDPHGHGGGGGGWTVPDEIGPLPFVRGAVGMPTSTKDDGGCQVFVMHTDYEPLDERYTRFGHVVDGMETVDRIRVGDRILGTRVALP